MERTKIEVSVVEYATKESPVKEIRELFDLELALIGGGIADPVWA